jgi:hypothetical protein
VENRKPTLKIRGFYDYSGAVLDWGCLGNAHGYAFHAAGLYKGKILLQLPLFYPVLLFDRDYYGILKLKIPLEKPLYQLIKKEKNFNHFLELITKSKTDCVHSSL